MRRFLVLTAIAVSVLAGCSSSSSTSSSSCRGIKVVSTVTQVSALVRAVGGDCVDLTALLKPTDDPHAYETKPGDVVRLAGAGLILTSGAGIDKWLDKSIQAAAPQTPVLALSTVPGVKIRQGDEGQDPHWWYDVDNAKAATDAIAAKLGQLDSPDNGTFTRNAAALKARLDDADRKVHAVIDPIPAEKRLFVANHDAFNYFLARYNITLVGDIIPSTDTLSAVRPADTAKLIADIKSKNVKAIFTETTLDSAVAQQIASEAGVKIYDGKLYGDAIGDAGTDGATLEGAIAQDGQMMAAAFKL